MARHLYTYIYKLHRNQSAAHFNHTIDKYRLNNIGLLALLKMITFPFVCLR